MTFDPLAQLDVDILLLNLATITATVHKVLNSITVVMLSHIDMGPRPSDGLFLLSKL